MFGLKPIPRFGIVTALPEEYTAVKALLPDGEEYQADTNVGGRRFYLCQLKSEKGGTHQLVLALAGLGTNIASIRAQKMMTEFPTLESIIMVGIAGGIPNVEKPVDHVRLGDVVVSGAQGVIQYDFDKETISETVHRHPPRPPSAALLEAVKLLEADALANKCPWLAVIKSGLKTLKWKRPQKKTDQTMKHPKDPHRVLGQPRIFVATIACANKLLKNPKKRDYLGREFGVKAVEMESSGIADATWDHHIGYLAIRGICDYCDEYKTDVWHYYAAMSAAGYMCALLESIPGRVEKPKIKLETTRATSDDAVNNIKRGAHLASFYVPYDQNIYFQGREHVIREIRSKLRDSQLNRAGIYGLGGIGKTQTVVEYIYRYRNEYESIIWIRGDDEFYDDIIRLATKITSNHDLKPNVNQATEILIKFLGNIKNFLIVIDNVEHPKKILSILPRIPQGDVIITSRSPHLKSCGVSSTIELKGMSSEESTKFLMYRTGRDCTGLQEQESLQGLVNELNTEEMGCLPLALEQVAAHIDQHKIPFSTYLKAYIEKRVFLLKSALPDIGQYNESVFTTWSLNFDAIRGNPATAASAELLNLSAFLFPDRIPYEFLENGFPYLGSLLKTTFEEQASIAKHMVLEPLFRYSLIHLDQKNETYSLHTLVQETIRASLDDEKCRQYLTTLEKCFSHIFPAPEVDNWDLCARLISHAVSIIKSSLSKRWFGKSSSFLILSVVRYLYEQARYVELINLSEFYLKKQRITICKNLCLNF